jgi:hypothetical protein
LILPSKNLIFIIIKMSNKHLPAALGQRPSGNVEAYLTSMSQMFALNDGQNFYDVKQVEPTSQMPSIGNNEIEIYLTDSDYHVSQITHGFLTLDVKAVINSTFNISQKSISNLVNNNLIHYFVGLKSGSNFIRDYTLFHNGQTITNSLQNDATIESFLYNTYKPRSEKNNRKHIHSLWENVHTSDGSYCGVTFSMGELKDSNNNITVKFQVSIPHDDILALSAMDDFPNGIFGDLKIRFRVNPDAFVFCQISPQHLYENDLYMNKITGFDAQLLAEKLSPMQLWDNINTNLQYTRAFTQCGVQADLITKLLTQASASTTEPMRQLGQVGEGTFRITNITIERCVSTISGYKVSPQTFNNLANYYSSHYFLIPAQRVEPHQFPTSATSTGLKTTQNIPLVKCTDLCFLFPTHSEDITCFTNPQYKDLISNLVGRNIPNKPVNTTDAQFFQQMLNASDLDSIFEATEEYETSLTLKLNSDTARYKPHKEQQSSQNQSPASPAPAAGQDDGDDFEG